jgi:hypothetical protein
MARKQKRDLDLYEQMIGVTHAVDKDTAEVGGPHHIDLGVNARDRLGLIIREVQWSRMDLLANFNANGDLIRYGLTFRNQITALSQVVLSEPASLDYNEYHYKKDAAPTMDYVWDPVVRKSFRNYAGGGLLVHASRLFSWSYTIETSAPASDVDIYGRIYFLWKELTDQEYTDLWESMMVPVAT